MYSHQAIGDFDSFSSFSSVQNLLTKQRVGHISVLFRDAVIAGVAMPCNIRGMSSRTAHPGHSPLSVCNNTLGYLPFVPRCALSSSSLWLPATRCITVGDAVVRLPGWKT